MPDVNIVSREHIAYQAAAALHLQRVYGGEPTNPYPVGSDAHAAFEASLHRLATESVEGAEASA